NFISWSRWFFMQAQSLEAPQLLELVNGCSNPVGKDLIKSLLRRQNTSSMDAWAERLRDPNGSIVEEVIDVIVESDLGEQAKPLFLDTLQHKAAAVRARSIEVLTPFYDAQVREAVLPLITDPDSRVRLSILSLAQTLRDSSLAPYFIQVAQSDDSYSYGEDELRRLFETIALLGGAKLTDLFESRLSLESSGGVVSQLFKSKKSAIEDTSMRRAAISGLAILGDTKSVNLIKKVHRNAELSLAAHCEVALKTADRVRKNHEQTSEEARGEKAIEDWDAFSGLMGDRMLFLPNDLGLNAERIVAVSKEPSQSPKTENLEESATVESRNDMPRRTEPSPDNLYTAGESVLAMRRLLGQPSVLTGGDYRILDLQLAIVPLAEVTHTVKPTLKKGAAIEKKRAAISNENIDDLLKSYVETEHSQNSESVDEILQGYLGGETDPPPQRETSDQDLESLLMDYAQEDTKGSK
ncbi:MAG: HEAT repeat domain-containing protein, partial [Bradymonadia bacterium]